MTGRKFDRRTNSYTGPPFDYGRVSDWDLALAGEDLLAAARAAGIELRGRGTRTGPLTMGEVDRLGLALLREAVDGVAEGRPFSFMIYRTVQDVMNRGPGQVFPR